MPKSVFVPDGTEWLDEGDGQLGARLGQRRDRRRRPPACTASACSGPASTAPNWSPKRRPPSPPKKRRKSKSQVQNQGESTENGVTVSVTVDGGDTLQGTSSSIGAGETGASTIPLTPAPKGEVTLEVEVEPVPGEQVSENNEASYTVEFE